MCLSCKSKRVWSFVQNRMTGFPIKFDHNQVQQLRKKFKKISANKQQIDKQSFQMNMGILGLKSAYGFSDRLFNSFDIDKDGKISFQDFLQYMEVLKSGSQKHKAKISFRLIDIKNKDKVDINDFKQFLDDYFRSWTSITNSIITPEIKERTDHYVNFIFKKVKRDTKKNFIDFLYYAQKLYCDKDFTDAFQFITEGVANMFISDRIKDNDDSLMLHRVLKEINILYSALTEETKTKNLEQTKSRNLHQTKTKKTMYNYESRIQQKVEQIPDFFDEQIPDEIPYHIPKFTPFNSSYLGGKDKTGKTQQETYNNIQKQNNFQKQCKNCSKFDILEKKIGFILGKLKYLVQQTKQAYERLSQKYLTQNLHANKKKQTIGNIHVHHRPNTAEGNMIFFGDDNWNLVLNMMIGIQMAVRSVRGYQQMIYEEPKDFNLKYYFELVPRRFGDQEYMSQICSFTDYAPQTFNHIRKIFKIDNEQYIQSIGPNKLMASLMMGQVNSMTSLTSQGKSGSFFYYTADGKYMLKTIQYRQYKFLRNILEDYYYYIKKNPQTMITKFFGLHKLIQKDHNGDIINKSYFTIMANVFNTKDKIVERYDIKGSWYGRQNLDPHPNSTKKDNDFKKRKPLELNYQDRQNLMKIIRKDAQFFRKLHIIDYSLLIGVIRKTEVKMQATNFSSRLANQSDRGQFIRQTRFFEDISTNESYIFGIIDILTQYSTRKTMQYYFKRTFYGQGISAVPPDQYCQRFVNFIDDNVFKKSSNKVSRFDLQIGSARSQYMQQK